MARGWLWIAVLPLAGCGVRNLWLDDTARIEAAWPLPAAVEQSRLKLEALVANDSAAHDKWRREFESRRDLRALKCLSARLSLFDDDDDIRRKVDSSCLKAADAELQAWTQGSRLGILLTLPALRPVPTELPKFIATTDVPDVFGMADAAPIIVVARNRKLEVLDAGSGQTIFRDEALAERPGFLAPSPNGRVFSAGEGSSVVLRESESGDVLATFTGYRGFAWLDATTGIFTDVNLNQRALFDGATGTLSQPKGMTTYTGTVVRVGENPARYVVPGYMRLAKFELSHEGGPQIRMLEQRDRPPTGGQNGSLLGTPDGRHVVIADPRSIVIADTETLEVRSFPTGRFNPLEACALDEPDAVLIKGSMREQWFRNYYYVFSLDDETFSPVEDDRLLPSAGGVADCPVRFNALKAVYVKTQSGFRRLDGVKRGARYAQGALEAHFTEVFDAEQQRLDAVRAREAAASSGASYAERMTGVPAKPVLADVTDASIEAVGVYEAENSSRGAGAQSQRWPGPVTVLVRRADKPIVLVLTSYEAVTWHLNVMAGAKLQAILLGGYKSSTIVGAGSTRVVRINGYAYEANSNGYAVVDKEVQRVTGHRIENFQGRYGGKTFMVGGR
jgi:hypothetical protein